ncbi:MAG: anti-sigma factor [Reichenbachiella sp.]|uniref:anti-sigma factor n=1 Tax=Reichenbachiella sp. TaxID=2184521 RepID=UPI003296AB06
MKKILLALLAISITFYSCDDDDDNTGNLTIDISGLDNLGDGFLYEGWVIVDGAPISTGTFSVDDDGDLSASSFNLDGAMLDAATTFVLTIEPNPDSDPEPSATKLLGGDFSGSSASATIMHAAAFGMGFSDVTGGYILATPTTTDDSDEASGVWFLDNSSGSPAIGLNDLPDLSSQTGWTYEGWAVLGGTPVSTGTFDMASGFDDNATSTVFKGDDGDGPAFPGEDFVQNAPSGLSFPTDLKGATIVISIEPVPDNSAAPFTLKPLAGEVPTTLDNHTYQTMDNIASSTYPSGTIAR